MLDYLIAVAVQIGIYALMSIGLNLQFGYGGIINFGIVGFYALGAYAVGILAVAGMPPLACLLAVVAVCALASLCLGLLTLRLRGDFLAIVTLGFSEVLRIVALNEAWLTGGSAGISGIPRFAGAGAGSILFVTVGVFVVLAVLVNIRLMHSPFGRAVRAIRDDEEAFKALGKDPLPYRLWILLVGAVLMGCAGGFQAYNFNYISPEQFYPDLTFLVWIALILGGAGTIIGSVGGAVLLFGILEGSRFLRDLDIGIAEVEIASIRLALVGAAMILLILYRPEGLFGRKP